MRIKEIIQQCGHLKIVEKRSETDEFADLVISNDEIDEWHNILSRLLDAPRKPKGQPPNEADLQITANTGGIRTNQTLFEKEFGDTTVIAKFWPWGNGKLTTLRMALLINK